MDYAESMTIIGSGGSAMYVEDDAALVNSQSAFDRAVADGRAYSWASVTYDPDAHDTVLGVQNTSKTHHLRIHKILVSTDAAGMAQVFTVSGTTMTGTAVTGTNLNRNSGRVAEASAKADDTGNGEQALGYTAKLLQQYIAADTTTEIDVDGSVYLPYGCMIGVDLTTAATAGNVTITGWFEPI